MKKVIVASENPVKIAVARRAFETLFSEEEFEFVGMKSPSGVPDQPINDETKDGAINRMNFIRKEQPKADYWIGLEGGIYEEGDRYYNRAWMAVTDSSGYVATSATAQFYLPKEITQHIKSGDELGTATDKFFRAQNSKQGLGAIGFLTDGSINREDYYVQAVIIAISELKHQDWY